MPTIDNHFTEGMVGKKAAEGHARVDTFRVNPTTLDAGVAVQRVSGSPNEVEQFDGSQKFLGVALWSSRADQDFQRTDDARDRAEYQQDDMCPVLQPGSEQGTIVQFSAAATEGQFVYVQESDGLFVADDNAPVAVEDDSNVDLTVAGDADVGGVTISDGDHVLLQAQSTASENGLYEAVTANDQTTWTQQIQGDLEYLSFAEVHADTIQTGNNNHIGALNLGAREALNY